MDSDPQGTSPKDNNRLSTTLRQLAGLYKDLSGHLTPSNSLSGAGRGMPSSRPPIRIDVLDLIIEIEACAHMWTHQARVMANIDPFTSRLRDTDLMLYWVADYASTTDALDMIGDTAADLVSRAKLTVGETERPQKLEIHCPYCNSRLRAYPAQGLVFCSNRNCKCDDPDCKHQHKWSEQDWQDLGLLIQSRSTD
jgi:hypothetical protein